MKKAKVNKTYSIQEALELASKKPMNNIDDILFPVKFKDGETLMMPLKEIFKIPGGREAVLKYFEETK